MLHCCRDEQKKKRNIWVNPLVTNSSLYNQLMNVHADNTFLKPISINMLWIVGDDCARVA